MRSIGSGWVVLSAGLALLGASPVWADIEFSQKVDRSEMGSEDTVRLSVVVVDAPPSAQVQLPAPRDFEVLSSTKSNQRSIQLSGGGPVVIRDITTHTLVLQPLRTGKLTIPPAELTTADRTYRTELIELMVKAGRLVLMVTRDRVIPIIPRPEFQISTVVVASGRQCSGAGQDR
jgi:hypothetical protein